MYLFIICYEEAGHAYALARVFGSLALGEAWVEEGTKYADNSDWRFIPIADLDFDTNIYLSTD